MSCLQVATKVGCDYEIFNCDRSLYLAAATNSLNKSHCFTVIDNQQINATIPK